MAAELTFPVLFTSPRKRKIRQRRGKTAGEFALIQSMKIAAQPKWLVHPMQSNWCSGFSSPGHSGVSTRGVPIVLLIQHLKNHHSGATTKTEILPHLRQVPVSCSEIELVLASI
jgi:hypothetical protein